jgi:hypothetical protein
MPALILHLLAGLLAGAMFRVQTLLILALAVLVEGAAVVMIFGASAACLWLLANQSALQFGYLGGVYLHSLLREPNVTAQSGRRPAENPVRDVWPG